MINQIKKFKHWKQLAASFISFFPVCSLAFSGHSYLGVSAAATFAGLETRTPKITYNNNATTDSYQLNNTGTTSLMTGVNFGYEIDATEKTPAFALGLGGYFTPVQYKYNGSLIESVAGLPNSTLNNFQFNLSSTRVMLEAQLTFSLEEFSPAVDWISPFVNVGVGTAWNHFNSYSESPTSGSVVVLPPFQARTVTNFAFQAGFGIFYSYNFASEEGFYKHERVSLGYRYVDLGNVSSDIRSNAYPYKLNFGKLVSNEVYLSFTHLF